MPKLRPWCAHYTWSSRNNLTGEVTLRFELYVGKARHPNDTPAEHDGRRIDVRLDRREIDTLIKTLEQWRDKV